MNSYSLVLALILSVPALASSLPWEDNFISEACAPSEGAARRRARASAEGVVDLYASDCKEEGGQFSSRIRDGFCSPETQGNPGCTVTCSVIGHVRCTSPL